MRTNVVLVALILGALSVAGVVTMTHNMDVIQHDNNAFAKDCNDRGGVAYFWAEARQCIGAKAPQGQSSAREGDEQ